MKWHKRGREKSVTKLLVKLVHKIGFTRKKTYGYRERDEETRQEFIVKISQKKLEERVYIDESGIDNRARLRLWLE
jgi:hypothetical protein